MSSSRGPPPGGKCNSAIPVHSPGLLVHQEEEDGTSVCLYACSGHADRDVPGFLPRKVLKDMTFTYVDAQPGHDDHKGRRRRNQIRCQRHRKCLAGCPRVLRDRGRRLYTNDAASRSTVRT